MTELTKWDFWRAVAAEFVGMLLFIFIAIISVLGNLNSAAWDLKVSLAFALAIATLAQSLGHVSGAHLNPAVSLGLMVSCQISLLRFVFYVLAQMLGAVVASAIVYAVKPQNIDALGVNQVRGGVYVHFDIYLLTVHSHLNKSNNCFACYVSCGNLFGN